MPTRDYENYRDLISNWPGSQSALQNVYDEIYRKYDDGAEMLYRLDKYNRRFSRMDLHQ